MIATTNDSGAKVLSDKDARADLEGAPRKSYRGTWAVMHCDEAVTPVTTGGRVTVERTAVVMTVRERAEREDAPCEGGSREQAVRWVAERWGEKTTVSIKPCQDTTITLPLDDLVEILSAVCPPWLLRKKLGL